MCTAISSDDAAHDSISAHPAELGRLGRDSSSSSMPFLQIAKLAGPHVSGKMKMMSGALGGELEVGVEPRVPHRVEEVGVQGLQPQQHLGPHAQAGNLILQI